MSGSSPEPDAVTASAGTPAGSTPLAPAISARRWSIGCFGLMLKRCWECTEQPDSCVGSDLVGLNSRLTGAAVTVEREMNPLSNGSVAGLSTENRC